MGMRKTCVTIFLAIAMAAIAVTLGGCVGVMDVIGNTRPNSSWTQLGHDNHTTIEYGTNSTTFAFDDMWTKEAEGERFAEGARVYATGPEGNYNYFKVTQELDKMVDEGSFSKIDEISNSYESKMYEEVFGDLKEGEYAEIAYDELVTDEIVAVVFWNERCEIYFDNGAVLVIGYSSGTWSLSVKGYNISHPVMDGRIKWDGKTGKASFWQYLRDEEDLERYAPLEMLGDREVLNAWLARNK